MATAGALKELRQANRLRVIDVLRRHRTASRADIARATGLSPATISTLVADLQDRGVVVEYTGAPKVGDRRQGGRPPVLLSLDATAGVALGIAFGHARLRVAVADLSSRVLAERTVELDVDGSASTALDAATELAEQALDDAGVERSRAFAAGVGLPGPVDRVAGRLGSTALMHGWTGVRPRDELERRLRLPVDVDNDARLGALAEATQGAARGAEDLIYILLSEGVGAGLILGGRLHYGSMGFAGEVGHNEVRPGGLRCRCGKRGCLETVASVPALLGTLGEGARRPTLEEALEASANGDRSATEAFRAAGTEVGYVVATLCNAVNPSTVVLGGQLAAAGAPLLDGVRDAMARHVSAEESAAPVVLGELGDRAAVLGALALVIGDTDRLRSAGLPALTQPPIQGELLT